jgi:hypothetical protein
VPKAGYSGGESWIELTYALTDAEWAGLADKYKMNANGRRLLTVRRYFVSKDKVRTNQSNIYAIIDGKPEKELFYGAKNVGTAKVGRLIYIPAFTTAADQMKTTGPSPLRDMLNFMLKRVVSDSAVYQRSFLYELIKLAPNFADAKKSEKREFDPDFTLILFEEPEAFLHPAQQENMAYHLRRLGAEEGQQVIITSHSPIFVGKVADDLCQIVRIHREQGISSVRQIARDKIAEVMGAGLDFRQCLNSYVGDPGVSDDQKKMPENFLKVQSKMKKLHIRKSVSAISFGSTPIARRCFLRIVSCLSKVLQRRLFSVGCGRETGMIFPVVAYRSSMF